MRASRWRVVLVAGIGVHRKARCTLGSLEALLFEMLFVRRHPVQWLLRGDKEKVMVETSDPPSDERKYAQSWKRARVLRRNLVTRRTLMIAIRAVVLAVRVAEILNRLFGGF